IRESPVVTNTTESPIRFCAKASRMEAHIFDGGHFLLETHAEPALSLMKDFIRRTQKRLTRFPSL
ncbi:hypothetical protein ACWUKX_15580, partial [Mesorhizobium sp. f-mel]